MTKFICTVKTALRPPVCLLFLLKTEDIQNYQEHQMINFTNYISEKAIYLID